jgi:shikimate kinase
LLLGPQGVGKSFIGKLLVEKTKLKLLDTDSIFQSLREKGCENFDELGYRLIKNLIVREFKDNDILIIESTGASTHFLRFYYDLKEKYTILTVNVRAPLNIVKERMIQRCKISHIKYSSKFTESVYHSSESLAIPYDFVIYNSVTTVKELIASFTPIINCLE